jgi:predicted nucleic acid-binding protein
LSLIIDSSITLAWYFADEQTKASRAVLMRVAQQGAVVPPLWWFEVANGLQMAMRRRRVDSSFRDRALLHLGTLGIDSDSDSETHAWTATVKLADRHALTIYDAAYLELAQRRRLDLATLDNALIRAAQAEFVTTIGS